jgi:hypothetical protein
MPGVIRYPSRPFSRRIASTVVRGSSEGGYFSVAISQRVSPEVTVYGMGSVPAPAPVAAYRAQAMARATNIAPSFLLRYTADLLTRER